MASTTRPDKAAANRSLHRGDGSPSFGVPVVGLPFEPRTSAFPPRLNVASSLLTLLDDIVTVCVDQPVPGEGQRSFERHVTGERLSVADKVAE